MHDVLLCVFKLLCNMVDMIVEKGARKILNSRYLAIWHVMIWANDSGFDNLSWQAYID